MPEQPYWGNVNLGVDVLQGHGEQSQNGARDYIRSHPSAEHKIQYNPGRNQELNLPPDIFRMQKNSAFNPYSQTGRINRKGMHERIKELIGEGQSPREARVRAKQEYKTSGNDNKITPKDVYRSKYQSPTLSKQISPLTTQVQEYPFL